MADRSGATHKRVLIVDDEPGMREMLGLLLTRHGYSVCEAGNGNEALRIIAQGAIDIVLTDVRMPELDGLGLLQRLHDLKLPVTVIMMSAFVELEDAIRALKMGAADYVSKPFRADEVLLKIGMALERQRIQDERELLRAENTQLRHLGSDARAPMGLVGKSPRFLETLATVRKIADYKSTVLLYGESGTGKELLARALHAESVRQRGPFVPINCGAIPETLLESELFGHVKGAFTDASRTKTGLIEEASSGTLFLDEIGELPVSLQVKLLRFLQEDEIRRVGDVKDIKVDVRVVAATARDLQKMVADGGFREDLYYRLNVLQLRVPPLRERKEDIPILVEHFVAKYGERLHKDRMAVSPDAMRVLLDYAWPGNIRELENMVERAMVLSESSQIDVSSLPERLRENVDSPAAITVGSDLSLKKAVRALENELIKHALAQTGGNRTRAAVLLDISHRALLYKIKEYGLH